MRSSRLWTLLVISACYSLSAVAEEPLRLAPVVKEGAPADVLSEDPVLPARGGASTPQGSGGLEHALASESPQGVQDTGRPGAFAQFRGQGRSAEDINVQTLGIPLNPPQGGGLSLSVFPGFLWSDYRFQQGPSQGTMDPRGVSGSLVLTPWTARAVRETGSSGAAAFQLSDQGFRQWVAGGRTGGRREEGVAALAGYTDGRARGPSGSLSLRREYGGVRTTAHLLASDIDAADAGSASFPTPRARFRTQRWIPVLQVDFPLGSEMQVKSGVFHDQSILRYADPDSGWSTHDRARQYGVENAIFWRDWRFGLSARQIGYEMATFLPPEETLGNLLVARAWESGDWLVEPTVSAIWASRFGVLPQASLGLRRTLTGTLRAFGRASFSRNVPSLQNRYYSYPGLTVPNADLGPELDYTLSTGVESATEGLRHVLELFAQWRERAQVQVAVVGGTQTVNSGAASLASVTDTVSMDLGKRWVFTHSASLSTSRVEKSGRKFQYLPDFVDVFSLAVTSTAERGGGRSLWKCEISGRLSTSAETATAGRDVAGYVTWDAGIQYQLTTAIQLQGRVENLLDRRYETFADYPNVGRVLFLRIAGEF